MPFRLPKLSPELYLAPCDWTPATAVAPLEIELSWSKNAWASAVCVGAEPRRAPSSSSGRSPGGAACAGG